MSEKATHSYGSYWIAWFVLLLITLAMVFIGSKPVLAGGMIVKAAIKLNEANGLRPCSGTRSCSGTRQLCSFQACC